MHEPSEIDQIIKNLGFNRTYDVTALSSVAKLFPSRRRGIYVLHFANGVRVTLMKCLESLRDRGKHSRYWKMTRQFEYFDGSTWV